MGFTTGTLELGHVRLQLPWHCHTASQHARTPERDKTPFCAFYVLRPDVGSRGFLQSSWGPGEGEVAHRVAYHSGLDDACAPWMPGGPNRSLHACFLPVTRTVDFRWHRENSTPLHEEHARSPIGLTSLDTLVCRDVSRACRRKAAFGDLSRMALDVATDIRRLHGDVWCCDTSGSLNEAEPV